MTTRFGFVSTYPPTQCGLATFTAALRHALVQRPTDEGQVVRLVETPGPRPAEEVVAQLVQGDPVAMSNAVMHLNACDVAIVQHEYGVYGGRDGAECLTLLKQLCVPAIVVLHTVLTHPTPHQHELLEAIVSQADAVVTMTAAAHDRLAAGYAVDMSKVNIIAHGASEVASARSTPTFRNGQFTILSWGLLGPGKGIEWGIEAMALLGDLRPAPRYVVAGQTHPKVLLREGEAYRDQLLGQVRRLHLESCVSFDRRYRDPASLAQLVRSADLVLLPYDSVDQVTSGVLIEAVAAGKPVVATQFPHAVELLGTGAGLVVPQKDPVAMADALRTVITHPDVASGMATAAASAAPGLRWSVIAEQYRQLASDLIAASVAA